MRKLLGSGNTKLKKTAKHFNVSIFNFSIPAGNDKLSGKITCPFADGCLKFCYAKKGMYSFGNVQRALTERYQATKKDNFVSVMVSEISRKRTDKQIYIRIHDSGDFYSPKYLNKWFEIARELPNVRFYAYTKSHDFFRGIELPENFDITLSIGSKLDSKLNRQTEKHAEIFDSLEELKNEGYINASEYDLYCTKWYNNTNKVGLVIH
jgi:hypothetical protein